jgi:hypothetical protein
MHKDLDLLYKYYPRTENLVACRHIVLEVKLQLTAGEDARLQHSMGILYCKVTRYQTFRNIRHA